MKVCMFAFTAHHIDVRNCCSRNKHDDKSKNQKAIHIPSRRGKARRGSAGKTRSKSTLEAVDRRDTMGTHSPRGRATGNREGALPTSKRQRIRSHNAVYRSVCYKQRLPTTSSPWYNSGSELEKKQLVPLIYLLRIPGIRIGHSRHPYHE